MSWRRARRIVVGVTLAGLSLLAAGCGGSKSPAVANLTTTSNTATAATGKSSGNSSESSTGTGSNGNATVLLVEWAACMRSHGDPNQTDPTIDNHWGINITIPLSAPETLSNEVHGGTAPCNQFLAAAGNALKTAHPAPPPPSDNASGVRYAACMRAHGIHNYPDPTGAEKTNLLAIDMNSPFFIRANKLCGKQIGAPAWWINGWGPPGNISVSNIPPGGLGPNGPNRPRSNSGAPTTSNAAPSG